MKENRSALWALLGVALGFGLPALACLGLAFVFSISLATVGSQAAPTPIVPVQVSGPMSGPAVAIVEINGQIVSGRTPPFSSLQLAASGDIIPLIRAAALESDVRAILLAVNSPGGSVVPSDEIYHELQSLQIPIVVQMEEVAASGAYYLSMAADHIIANPNTLTGSIGVISTFPNAQELLDKVGVQFTVITTGEAKDFGSLYRPMTPEERQYWQQVVDETHGGFVSIVAEGRNLDEAEVRELADGRIFTGRQAILLDLVDELGYQEDAIAKAAQLGGITEEPRVIRYQKFSPLSSLFGESLSGLSPSLSPEWARRLMGPSLEFRWIP